MENKSNNFLLGLMTGIAILSTVGFLIMTAAYFQKGKVLSDNGAKTEKAQIDSKKSDSGEVPAIKAEITVGKEDYVRGGKDAPVTIVEFSDFQCPFCSRFHSTMVQIMENYEGNVKWVYKHFPLTSIHPYARKAGLASECAGEQGKFWEYADLLYKNQASFSDDYFFELAGQLKLDQAKFDKCLVDEKYAGKVDGDTALGRLNEITGTPASFINGIAVKGAYPYEEVQKIIDSLLK